MAILGKCPACGEPVEVPEGAPSGKARCGQCGVPFTPAEGGSFVSERARRASARSRREAVTREPDDDRSADWSPEDDRDELPRPRRRRPRCRVALDKVSGPAVLLIVYGVLCLVAAPALLVFGVLAASQNRPDPAALVLGLLGALLCLAAGGLVLVGGIRMRALRNYGLAIASVIVIFVVGLLTCIPLALVGIWPLVVLLDPEVKASFDQAAP
jgi:hypothetical protein